MTIRILLMSVLLWMGSASFDVTAKEEPAQEPEELSQPQAFDPDKPPQDLEKEKRALTWDEEEILRAAAKEEERLHGMRPDEETRFRDSLSDKKPKQREPKPVR